MKGLLSSVLNPGIAVETAFRFPKGCGTGPPASVGQGIIHPEASLFIYILK
jgi:hypothetical protein